MSGLPKDHKLGKVYRYGGGVTGLVLLTFGTLGFVNHLAFFSTEGKVYRMKVWRLPEGGPATRGRPTWVGAATNSTLARSQRRSASQGAASSFSCSARSASCSTSRR